MFWDYLKPRLSLIIGLFIGIIVFVLLLLFSSNTWAIIGFLPLYLILLRSFVKRASIKAMHDWERKLYKHLDVLDYASKYDYLAKKGVKFDERWTVSKYHNALLGNIFLANHKKNELYMEYLEDTYQDFYSRNAAFKYMYDILKAINAFFFEDDKTFKRHLKTSKKTFDALPENIRKQIKSNEASFHNWLLWNDKHLVGAEKSKAEKHLPDLRSMAKLNAVGSYYYLKKTFSGIHDDTLEGYLQNAFIMDRDLNN